MPTVATVMENLAIVYTRDGCLQEASKLMARAIAIEERTTGADNPNLIGTLENYATLLRNMKEFAGAEMAETKANGIRVRNALLAEKNGR